MNSAPNDQPTSPATQTTVKRPWYKKKRIVIPLGAVVAIAVITNLNNNDSTTETTSQPAKNGVSTTSSSKAQTPADEPADQDSAAKPGTPVRDGKFEFVVAKPTCGKKTVGSQYLNATAQGQFCIVPMTVKNVGDKAQTFSASNQKAFIGDASYEADTMASMYVETGANGKSSSFLEKINPGNSVKGSIVFDVPKGKTLDRIEVHDSVFSSGVEVQLR